MPRRTDGQAVFIHLLWRERQAFPAAVGSRGEGQLLVPRPFLAGPLEREQAPGQGLEAARWLCAGGGPVTSGLGHSHWKPMASRRGKLTELWLWAEKRLGVGCLLTHVGPTKSSGFLEILIFPEPELMSNTGSKVP